jgi:hypothetical protein
MGVDYATQVEASIAQAKERTYNQLLLSKALLPLSKLFPYKTRLGSWQATPIQSPA